MTRTHLGNEMSFRSFTSEKNRNPSMRIDKLEDPDFGERQWAKYRLDSMVLVPLV